MEFIAFKTKEKKSKKILDNCNIKVFKHTVGKCQKYFYFVIIETYLHFLFEVGQKCNISDQMFIYRIELLELNKATEKFCNLRWIYIFNEHLGQVYFWS